MPTKEDGGQAFPQPVAIGPAGDLYPAYPGMTLRDYFAGQALNGLLAAGDPESEVYGNAASYAYAYADAMLAERSK